MKRTPLLCPRTAAFNLLEIMIVVVIIALLISIGLPAFGAAMKRAEWSKVQSQMKSVVTSFHSYASEHDGYFPPAWFPNGQKAGSWLDTTIFPYVYPESGYSAKDKEGKEVNYDAENGIHLQDTVFVVKPSVLAFPTEKNFYNHSFLLNRSLVAEATATNPAFAPRKPTMYEDWTSVMLLTEGSKGDHNSVSVSDLPQLEQGLKRYQGLFIHFAFLDGHVEQIKAKEVREMTKIMPGSGGDMTKDGWHAAWFGFTPDRMPSSENRSKPVNY
ncbi:MAG: type II secretion system GspH family protein [Verrucomicrobia bacterium]|nr:type II secretion system GspH family protein [Verrucomicrobiota bacterium]